LSPQTPRAQRTSTDAQTWEFSHHKFLRGRPDLLDEIKRKALEPDPAVKHRVELPGEVSCYSPFEFFQSTIDFVVAQVAAQLGAMRDENRRVWDQLIAERRRVEKLVQMVGRLWDVVGKGFPGSGTTSCITDHSYNSPLSLPPAFIYSTTVPDRSP
jgi:HSF-type DNA-binding